MTDGPTPTEPAATEPDAQPAVPKQFGDALGGDLMAQLRADVEAKVRPMLEPQPEPADPRLADLSEDDRSILEQREHEYTARLEQLRLENQLLALGQRYPNEVNILQKMLAGDSVEDYVTALHEALGGGREPEDSVADVDRNNPPRTAATAQAWEDMIRLPDGRLITREQGLEILKNAQTLYD